MADRFTELEPRHIDFIARQQMYLVGSAGAEGFVNISPKGMDSLRVCSPTRIAWLNLTGSGNETAAHVLENARMTIMFCSFDKQPLILRLYGRAELIYPRHDRWVDLIALFPSHGGARQIFELHIELVQTSCGYAVPYYEFQGQRPTLRQWADKLGNDGIEDYWKEKNMLSLEGRNTGIFKDI